MSEKNLEGMINISLEKVKGMVDSNSIIGAPITTPDGTTIIPISKVCFGFAAGGSEFNEETIDEYTRKEKDEESIKYKLPLF